MQLPENADMLLSMVNMKLRDEDVNLEELCSEWGINKSVVVKKLEEAGYYYDENANKFSAK